MHLQALTEYADTNIMKINTKKTKFVIFNPCTSVDVAPNKFSIDDQVLEYTESFKILGLMMSSNLKWDDHILLLYNGEFCLSVCLSEAFF